MSLANSNTVDAIGIERDIGIAVLTIADSWDWPCRYSRAISNPSGKKLPPGASENRRPDVFLGLRQQSARSIGMEIHAGNQHQLRFASINWEKMGTRGRTGVLSVRNLFTQAAIPRQVRVLASRGLPYARSAPVPGRSNATCPAARKFSTVRRRRELKTNKT